MGFWARYCSAIRPRPAHCDSPANVWRQVSCWRNESGVSSVGIGYRPSGARRKSIGLIITDRRPADPGAELDAAHEIDAAIAERREWRMARQQGETSWPKAPRWRADAVLKRVELRAGRFDSVDLTETRRVPDHRNR